MRTTYRYLALAAATGLAGWLQAATVSWDGGADGTGTSWNVDPNWAGDAKPTDVADFTNTATSGKTISLDASQSITQLTLNTTNTFTIGSTDDRTAGYTLSLSNVSRSSTSSGTQTIGAGVALAANSIWDIGGTGSLTVSGGISGAYSLTKRGTGTLTLSTTNASHTGGTFVEQGTLAVNRVIPTASGTPLVIGGAGYAATASIGLDQAVTRVTVNAGGTLNQGTRVLYPVSIIVAGGTWNAGQIYNTNNQSFTLRDGALVTGGWGLQNWAYAGTFNVSTGSTATCRWETAMRVGNNYNAPFNIGDGASPIDVIISASITGTAASNALSKTGVGTMQLTSNGNTFTRPVNVTAGTLLVDNTDITKSATGQGVVTVSAGATLGGAGSIGGGYATSAVTLSSGSASSRATIAPGSINNISGDAMVGTLTVGTAAQSNNVTFGAYGQLVEQVGNAGSNDRLTIYGNLSLAAANDLLALQTVSGATLAGEYTLAGFTGTLTGRFDSITLDGGGLGLYQVQYRDSTNQVVLGTSDITGGGSVVLVVPEPGTLILSGGMIAGALIMRRRTH